MENGLHTPSGWNTEHMSHSCLPAGPFASDSAACTAQTLTLLPFLQLRYSCSEAHPLLCRRYSENENVFDSFWRCNTSAKRGGKLPWQKLSVSFEHMFCLQRCAVRRQRGSFFVTSLWEPTMALTAPGKKKLLWQPVIGQWMSWVPKW